MVTAEDTLSFSLAVPPAGCVTQSKGLCCSEPDFPNLQGEKEIKRRLGVYGNHTSLPGLLRELNEVVYEKGSSTGSVNENFLFPFSLSPPPFLMHQQVL